MKKIQRAQRNRTITLTHRETTRFQTQLLSLRKQTSPRNITNKIICQDVFKSVLHLPTGFVDLLFLDPPYNLSKTYNSHTFREMKSSEYAEWLDSWLSMLLPTLKPTASVYICGDWRSSGAIQQVAEKYFIIRNRITWEREKGRGAKSNWKNNSEDIWFCTLTNQYYFNVHAVKLKRKVLAPYTHTTGQPKDWVKTKSGDFRLTFPSNIWNDITIPFWSMPENTEHPTQKPEKLLAKIILASSKPGDIILDPFIGSGTTAVVAYKLSRSFVGIEKDKLYACLALKRLEIAKTEKNIQGYQNGVFWERNTLNEQNRK